MKGFDVLRVKSAVKTRNKFDLSRTHLTTMQFGEILPLFAEETVPGDKFNVSSRFFARLAPLVKPTYGKFAFRTVAAFVPYHQIAVDAEAWLAGKTVMEGQTPRQRWFDVDTWHKFIKNYCVSATPGNATNADYIWVDQYGTTHYDLFSPEGKYYIKIMNSLGYACPSNVDEQPSSPWIGMYEGNAKLSAYPLLAFFKLYNDYMSQSQRFNLSALSDLLYRVKNNQAYSGFWNHNTGELYDSCIHAFFSNLFLNYDNDYFVSAWEDPNAALNTTESINSANWNSGSSFSVVSSPYEVTAVNTTLTQRLLNWLKSFDDWVRRNNYSGSRAVQQIYSRFGIKPDDFRAHYAHVIDVDSVPLQIGDVTATAGYVDANNTDIALGDYAGKGIMNGGKSVSYSADDFGMLFVFGYFTVVPMMSFGYDRRVLRTDPLDYYNPEFDGVGADPISYGEVYANPLAAGDALDTSLDQMVFGFTERYNAYRFGRDVITGEFRNYHPDGEMNVWHTGRNLNDVRKGGTMIAQSSAMNTLPQTNSEYNRIFSDMNGDIDHFYLTAHFEVSAVRPMLSLNQVPQLGEGDTNVPRNGNVIS